MAGTRGLWTIFLGTILLIDWQSVESLRILALFPINSKSHFNLFEALGKGLAAKGHQVDVYSSFPLKKSIPNYKDYSLKGSLPVSQNNMTYEEATKFQFINVHDLINFIGEPMCTIMNHPQLQNLLKNPPRDPPYDVVLVEAFFSNCHLAWGRYLDIPMVAVMTTSMFDWYHPSVGNPTTAIRAVEFGPMSFLERLSSTAFLTTLNALMRYYLRYQNKYVTENFGPDYPDVIDLQKDIDLLLFNSHQSLEGHRPYTSAAVPIAGLHIKDDDTKLPQDVQKWLDDSKNGCIYFSFGSMVRIETFPRSVLNEIYEAFKSIAPVRVLLKIANLADLPPGLPKNVMTQPWLNQETVLKHKNIKLFITHGGLMGTLEAIYYAVPMIGIPIFGDQHSNVLSNVEKGISKHIPLTNITQEALTSAITEIIHNPKYKENSNKFSKLFLDRPIKPMDSAIYWIEYIARHGKKSLRSTLVDMPWWQANLLDVYAFGFATLALVGVILRFIVKLALFLICRFYCSKKNSINAPSGKDKKIQ